MHSDQSVRHIALTCPHCGKHYKKVPYDAIKKHQFAFCKQCNKKFLVEPSVLEEALRQSMLAQGELSPEAAEAPDRHKKEPAPQAEKPASAPVEPAQMLAEQTIPGLQDIVQQAAAAAQDFLPEPPAAGTPHDGGMLATLFKSRPTEAEEQPAAQGSLEHDMTQLAATIDETFGRPHEKIRTEDAELPAQEPDASCAAPDRTDRSCAFEEEADYQPPAAAPDFMDTVSPAFEEQVMQQTNEPAGTEENFEGDANETAWVQSLAVDTAPQTDTGLQIPVERTSENIAPAPPEKLFIESHPKDAFEEKAADREPPEEPLVENGFVSESAEPCIEHETIAGSMLDEPYSAAALDSVTDQETSEDALAAGACAATQAEPFPEEDILEEALIEEPGGEQVELESTSAIQEQEALPAAAGRDFLSASGETEANRDVASMLKDLVLPTTDIREGMEQFVLFSLGEQLFAAPVANVSELSLPPDFIMLPNTPQWLLGIANKRGEIISIADLRGFLGMDQEGIKKTSRMIIAQTLDREMVVGLLVDRINGIHYFATDEILPFEQQEQGQAAPYVSGTCTHEDTAVAVLDLEKLLQSPKMGQFR